MEIKEDAKVIWTDDPVYDLCDGYIKPENFLESEEEVIALREAVNLVEEFLELMTASGKMEVR